MAEILNTKTITLNGTGTEIPTLSVSDLYTAYTILGTGITAVGDYNINPTGTPITNMVYEFFYEATVDITTNSTRFSIFSKQLTQTQLNCKLIITCRYTGSAWNVKITGSLDQACIDGDNIVDLSVETADIENLAVTTAKLANLGVTNAKIANDTIDLEAKALDDSLTADKINESLFCGEGLDVSGSPEKLNVIYDGTTIHTLSNELALAPSGITSYHISNNAGIQVSKLETIKFPLPVQVDFTPSGVGDFKVELSGSGVFNKIYAFVTSDLGASAGTIIVRNNAGTTMTGSTISLLASDPKGTAYAAVITANNSFIDGDIINIRSSGGGGQGHVLVTLTYTKTS